MDRYCFPIRNLRDRIRVALCGARLRISNVRSLCAHTGETQIQASQPVSLRLSLSLYAKGHK